MKMPFSKLLYRETALSDLILVCIGSVLEAKEECTFERLTKECFIAFPEVFCFADSPQWPDSRKLDRPLRELRKKKLIIGRPQDKFTLTKAGKKAADEISKRFSQRELFKI